MEVKSVTYVVPCYNEEGSLAEMYRRLAAVASELPDIDFEWLFVNDGSADRTAEVLNELAGRDRRVAVIHLARNCGHQNALTAGLDFADADVIITMDADLQDPPELVHDFIAKIEDGYDVVHAQRRSRKGETFFKLATARLFYGGIRKLSGQDIVENAGDFRAFNRSVLYAIQSFRERHRFLRGLFSYVGFRQCAIQYDRDARYAGETKYPFRKMFKFALDAVVSFSSSPVRAILYVAGLLWLTSLGYLIHAILARFVWDITVPGWTSTVVLLTFFSGVQLIAIAVIGEYVARVFEQGQQRPMYWVASTRNLPVESRLGDKQELLEPRMSERILRTRHDRTRDDDRLDDE